LCIAHLHHWIPDRGKLFVSPRGVLGVEPEHKRYVTRDLGLEQLHLGVIGRDLGYGGATP
jgi:hypothetical protein